MCRDMVHNTYLRVFPQKKIDREKVQSYSVWNGNSSIVSADENLLIKQKMGTWGIKLLCVSVDSFSVWNLFPFRVTFELRHAIFSPPYRLHYTLFLLLKVQIKDILFALPSAHRFRVHQNEIFPWRIVGVEINSAREREWCNYITTISFVSLELLVANKAFCSPPHRVFFLLNTSSRRRRDILRWLKNPWDENTELRERDSVTKNI